MSIRIKRLRSTPVSQRLIAVAGVSIALVALTTAPAGAAVSPVQGGAALLAQIQSGHTTCSKLSSSDLALMGEYDMGRIMGSTAAQSTMDAQMRATSGASAERSAYRFMGERLGGCATGNGPVAFGTMMGMMGTSMMSASHGSAHLASGDGSSMMGGYGSSNGGTGASVIAALVLGSLLLLALIVFLVRRRTPRRPTRRRTT
jgi:hypothetical protein